VDLGDRQRAAVARAAVELVSEGHTPLKVADLAERAGISRPTFYKYFPTLGAAVLHTVRMLLADLEAFLSAQVPEGENAREQLLARFSLSFEFARSRPELTRFFSFYDFSFRATELSGDEDVERSAISAVAGSPFHELFRAGQADGSIDPSLPVDVTYLNDTRALGVHDLLIELWRRALTPKENP
jgi:AcrR family transcriptional regulator